MRKRSIAVLSIVLAVSLTGCSIGSSLSKTQSSNTSNSKTEPKELVVVDWGGAYSDSRKKANYEPFEKKFGVKIKMVSPTDYGKLKAMVDSGNVEWDVINVDTDFSIRGGKQGLLEKLDYSVIKTEGIDKKFINDYGIGSETTAVALAYGTNTFTKDNHPQTWADFWDVKKYPGARSLQKYPEGTLEAALLADGVKPENLYPLDLDRAFASLEKIKPNIKIWWTSGAQPPQGLASGDLAVSSAWSGRITAAKQQGSPVEVEYNQAILTADSWVVPKGAPHKDLAMKFINFVSQADQQADFTKVSGYAPTNSKALSLLPSDVKIQIGQSSDEESKKQVLCDFNYWADNFEAVNERLEKWLLK